MAERVRGVVALKKGAPVTVETILVPDPGPGEAVVKVQACGVCHTDLVAADGGAGVPFPAVLGHEASHVVKRHSAKQISDAQMKGIIASVALGGQSDLVQTLAGLGLHRRQEPVGVLHPQLGAAVLSGLPALVGSVERDRDALAPGTQPRNHLSQISTRRSPSAPSSGSSTPRGHSSP